MCKAEYPCISYVRPNLLPFVRKHLLAFTSNVIEYVLSFLNLRLKLYYDHGEIKRYNGKRRMGELKAFVDKFAVTSEVRHNTRGSHVTEGLMCVH